MSPPIVTPLPGQPGYEIVLDPDGDLLLVVGTPPSESTLLGLVAATFAAAGGSARAGAGVAIGTVSRFRVSSGAMIRASRPWEVLLQADPRPLDKQADWVVDLPDDKPQPMRTLLEIAHDCFNSQLGRFGTGTDMGSTECLYDIAVLVDKYELLAVIRPWVKPWLRSVGLATNFDSQLEQERRLWIAWVFGSFSLFEDTIRMLVLRCNRTNWTPYVAGILAPPDAKEQLHLCRTEAINRLIRPFCDALRTLVEQAADESLTDGTQAAALEDLVCSLSQAQLWPLPSTQTMVQSAAELAGALERVRIRGCAWNPAYKVYSSLTRLSPRLPRAYRIRLESQARTAGLAIPADLPKLSVDVPLGVLVESAPPLQLASLKLRRRVPRRVPRMEGLHAAFILTPPSP